MKIKTLALIFLSLTMSISLWGYDFAYNGIYYNILSGNTSVEVTYGNTMSNSYSGSVTIPSSVSYSGRTYSVTSIGSSAFNECTGLTSVTLPNSVTSIGNSAFSGCTGLTSVTLPNSVTSIGNSAFYYCTGLTSVTLPNSVTSIGNSAFYGCTGITSPLYNNTIFAYMPTSYSGSYTIPSGITAIANRAFSGCTGLTSVTLPNSVTSIADFAFYNCRGLTSLTLPNSVTSIADFAFYNCTGLTSVTLPNSVTSIGDYAFDGCRGITAPIYNNTIFAYMPTSYSGSYTIPSGITTIAGSAFRNCTGLTSVTLPNSVTSIGDYTFTWCTGLTNVTIPNSVTSIGDRAFYNCTGITVPLYNNTIFAYMPTSYSGSYTIPSGITTIAGGAFCECTGLTSVTLPNSVTSIDNYAFLGCTGLTSVYFKRATPPTIGSDCFYSVNPTYYVPCGATSAYRTRLGASSTIVEYPGYFVTVLSSDTLLGTVTITQQPSCQQPAVIQASAIPHHHFVQWSDGNTSNPRTVNVSGDTTYTAIFEIDSHIVNVIGENGTVTGSGTYNYGTSVPLTATANEHYHFVSWSDGNTSSTRTIIVEGDTTYTATFELDKYVISGSGTNGTISGGGLYDYGSVATLTAAGDAHYHFVQWSDGSISNPRTVNVTGNATYTAIFEMDSHIVNVVGEHGTVTGSGTYNYGTSVPLTATANEHYHFVSWSDGNTSSTRTIIVEGDTIYIAIFEIDKHHVTATTTNGTIAGLGEYDYGATVSLTAIPDDYYCHVNWSDGDTSIVKSFVITGDVSFSADFTKCQYVITATCEHGTVTGSGTYENPDVVTLTVTPDEGYRFVKWSDDNEYNPRVFVVRDDLTVEAICEEAPVIDDVEDVQADAPAFYVVGTTVFNPSNEPLRVYSAAGKLLKSADTDIDLSGYPAGIYMIVDGRGNAIKVPVR